MLMNVLEDLLALMKAPQVLMKVQVQLMKVLVVLTGPLQVGLFSST